jgi:hypothetical protein
MDDMIAKLTKQAVENQENWLRAVFLKELGEEFYGKDDITIAEEAKKRGYQLMYTPHEHKHEVWDKDNNVISTHVINFKIN